MARPSIPETDKKRTVPFRMSKPDYRALATAMRLTDTTIQEHLRKALTDYLERELKRLAEGVSFNLPSPYEMGSWSDSQFSTFLDSIGKRLVDNPAYDDRTGKTYAETKAQAKPKAPSLKIGGKFKRAA